MCYKCREEGKPGGCPVCHRQPWPEPRTDVCHGLTFVFLRNATIGGKTMELVLNLRKNGLQGIFLEYLNVFAPHRPDVKMDRCVAIWATRGNSETISKLLGFESSENN